MWAQTPTFDHLHTNNLHAPWHRVGPQPTVPGHGSVAHARDGSPQAKPAQGQEKALVSNANCVVSLSLSSGEASLGCIAKTSVVSLLGAGNVGLGGCCPTPSQMGKESCLGEGAGQAGKLERLHTPPHMFPTSIP